MLNGWIILDKPSGITSAHAVAKVKRLLLTSPLRGEVDERGEEGGGGARSAKAFAFGNHPLPNPPPSRGRDLKIGHAGTLDPLASGILPLALGEATKTVPYMMDGRKSYGFTVTWGEERDTDDSEGKIIASSPNRPRIDDINNILQLFTGKIQQMPPNYSAIKVDGKRAYDMARNGEEVVLKAREVEVTFLTLNSVTGPPEGVLTADFTCHCGKGTYIRSLARDMGRRLGCFGTISRLRRLRVANFDESHAISLELLEKMLHKGALQTAQGAARSEGVWGNNIPQSVLDCFLRPVESALDDILARDISSDQADRIKRGQTIACPQSIPESTELCLRCEGKLVAIGVVSQGSVKPVRVFNL